MGAITRALENGASGDEALVNFNFLWPRTLGHSVSNAVMAVNAGHFFLLGLGMTGLGHWRLLCRIHLGFVMAKAAFARVVAFHVSPNPRRHIRARSVELVFGVHGMRDVVTPQVIERTHFGNVQRNRGVRHVAV